MQSVIAILAAIVVGTWNGNWFPSGRAEHRAHPDVERATISAAALMLAEGIRSVDPLGTNDIILCLNEIRGPRVASDLVAQIGRKGLAVASISGYRRRDRFDQQQDVIATTLPVVERRWAAWTPINAVKPPRGYAFAAVVISPATTAAVYATHLKSNYGSSRKTTAQMNQAKRTAATKQLLDDVARQPNARPVMIIGDMNADKWQSQFAKERLFNLIEGAGFKNLVELMPPGGRGSHPSRRYGDSALDYIFTRGFGTTETPRLIPNDELSDHLAVFTLVCP